MALVSATGERLVATPDHPIFAPTLGGFVDAGRMALGQVTRALIVEEGEAEARVREADLAPCETYAGVHEVFDLTVEGAFPTFVAEGFVVHNKSTLTDPSSTSTEGSGGPTGSETGIPTGSGTGGSGSGTGGSGTGEPTGTSGTSGTSGSGTSGSTGGGSGVCEAALGDYGDCDAVLGVAFDGTECATVSGCDCAPDCDKFFPDVASCALTCAEAGHCNPDRLEPAGILEDPVVMGSYCDELDACVSDPSLEGIFEQIFGMLACEGMGFPCPEGTLCHGLFAGPLAEEAWTQTCAATLVSGGGTLYCVLFGP